MAGLREGQCIGREDVHNEYVFLEEADHRGYCYSFCCYLGVNLMIFFFYFPSLFLFSFPFEANTTVGFSLKVIPVSQ